jgi:hypothetical protein
MRLNASSWSALLSGVAVSMYAISTMTDGRVASGAEHIERLDCLVRRIAKQQGLQSETLDDVVTLVDERLGMNRAAALSR